MLRHSTLVLLAAGLLAGCYWEPERAEILVVTNPPGASCVLSQAGHPVGTAEPTPAIALVALAPAEIGVLCSRPGFDDAAAALPPPPSARLPGWTPGGRGGIDYRTRVDLALVPKPPGVPR